MIDAAINMASGWGGWRVSYLLGVQDIRLRYKRSFLGPFWISAALVVTVLALAYVFAPVFRTGFVPYISHVATGLLTWYLIVALVNESCTSVTEHAAFLQNLNVPLTVIAGRIVLRNAIVFAHNLVAIMLLLFAFGARFSLVSVLAIPGACLILLFGYFFSMAIGPLCARFRDLPLVIQSVMQIMFFLTPIFWIPDASTHRPMFMTANPFYHFVELVRAPLLGSYPTPYDWRDGVLCCVGAAALAVFSVAKTRTRLILWL